LRKKIKIETRVEMREVWIIAKPRRSATVLCAVCASPQAVMLAPQEAAAIAGVTLRTLFRWVEAGEVHFLEQADGALWVCVNSLPATSRLRLRTPGCRRPE
jgi:hypothetical protein